MKFNFKIQQYQTEAVDAIVRVFNGQPNYDRTTYIRDLGKQKTYTDFDGSVFNEGRQMSLVPIEEQLTLGDIEIENDIGYKNEVIALTDAELLDNIHTIQSENNIKTSDKLAHDIGRCSLDIEMETGERVIIVTGCINAFKLRVSGTLVRYKSCTA